MATLPARANAFAGRWRIAEVQVNGDDSRIRRTQPPSSTAC